MKFPSPILAMPAPRTLPRTPRFVLTMNSSNSRISGNIGTVARIAATAAGNVRFTWMQ